MSITLELPGKENTAAEGTTGLVVAKHDLVAEVKTTLKEIEELSPEDKAQVDSFAQQIDLHNSELIMRYGETSQRKLKTFTTGALKGVTGLQVGEIGDLLAQMSTSIKNFNDEADSKAVGIFRSIKKKAEVLRTRYTETTSTLERVEKTLTGQRTTLLVDIRNLDSMYEQNLEYYKELTMYILAGKQRLEEVRNGELVELGEKAKLSGSQADAFRYRDLAGQCDDFEKQIYDLELTRQVCLQTAPQIRLVQKTHEQLARKIQSSITNTIPIWEQKIALALAIQHGEDAAKVQKQVTDLTNQMLEETARKLHASTVAAAREAERGIIDIEAIKASNAELLATIDDVLSIQAEGRQRRAEAEIELRDAEEQLKQRLLGTTQQTTS